MIFARASRVARTLLLALLALWLVGAAPAAEPEKPRLTFVVHPFDTPTRLYARFRPLCDYLSSALGRPVVLRVASTYEEQIEHIAEGKADLAYIGPTPYVRAHDRYAPVRLLAAEAENGKASYQSVIVVRTDSPVRQLADLRNRTVAFGADKSFSSFYIPRLMLQNAGVRLSDLKNYAYLGRHERVALAVLHKDFDAGGLRLEMAQQYLDRGLRIVTTSDPLPPHAIVASPKLAEPLAETVQKALIWPTPRGREAFKALGDEVSFVTITDKEYDLAREVVRRLE
jgi:phosphonate transport system substrate-binding protein